MFVSQLERLISWQHNYNSNQSKTLKNLFRVLHYVIVTSLEKQEQSKTSKREMPNNHDQQQIGVKLRMEVEDY